LSGTRPFRKYISLSYKQQIAAVVSIMIVFTRLDADSYFFSTCFATPRAIMK